VKSEGTSYRQPVYNLGRAKGDGARERDKNIRLVRPTREWEDVRRAEGVTFSKKKVAVKRRNLSAAIGEPKKRGGGGGPGIPGWGASVEATTGEEEGVKLMVSGGLALGKGTPKKPASPLEVIWEGIR